MKRRRFQVRAVCMRLAWIGALGVPAHTACGAPPEHEVVLVRVQYTVDSQHAGRTNDWNAKGFAKILYNVSEAASQATTVDVASAPKTLTLEDPELARYPFLVMVGHYGVTLNEEEVSALRIHLSRGGFLLATACCGNGSFARRFEREMKKVFPERPLDTLPPEHDIYKVFHDIHGVTCFVGPNNSKANRRVEPALLRGIELEGRTAVVFSRYMQSVPVYCRGFIQTVENPDIRYFTISNTNCRSEVIAVEPQGFAAAEGKPEAAFSHFQLNLPPVNYRRDREDVFCFILF